MFSFVFRSAANVRQVDEPALPFAAVAWLRTRMTEWGPFEVPLKCLFSLQTDLIRFVIALIKFLASLCAASRNAEVMFEMPFEGPTVQWVVFGGVPGPRSNSGWNLERLFGNGVSHFEIFWVVIIDSATSRLSPQFASQKFQPVIQYSKSLSLPFATCVLLHVKLFIGLPGQDAFETDSVNKHVQYRICSSTAHVVHRLEPDRVRNPFSGSCRSGRVFNPFYSFLIGEVDSMILAELGISQVEGKGQTILYQVEFGMSCILSYCTDKLFHQCARKSACISASFFVDE